MVVGKVDCSVQKKKKKFRLGQSLAKKHMQISKWIKRPKCKTGHYKTIKKHKQNTLT